MDKIDTKNLIVGDKIGFILSGNILEYSGIIMEKNYIGKGDIDYLIKIDENKMVRIKYRNLNLTFINSYF